MADSSFKPPKSNTAAAEISFERDIVPLFRPMDIECMAGLASGGVFLVDYDFMSQKVNAQKVIDRLKMIGPNRMPLGGPYWSDASIQLLQDWINGGAKP
jgi:hypothetical protein